MNLVLTKGNDFLEHFDFKNAQGSPLALPSGKFKIVLERGGFAREYTINNGLTKLNNRVNWIIRASESNNFEYTTMYYTLYLDDVELSRGVLKIQ